MEQRNFGDYTIIRQLGEGSLGTAYLAEHRFLKRKFLLKILPSELSSTEGFLKRFEKEVTDLSSLDHPHIVKVHNVSCFDGKYFLVTDYVEGLSNEHTNLSTYLKINKRHLTESEIVDILTQVASALSYAHEKKISHRNLKLNNVLLSRREGKIVALVSDFGLAHILGEGAILTRMYFSLSSMLKLEIPKDGGYNGALDPAKIPTLHQSFLQNYAFLAPEQKVFRETPVGTSSDVYAFGVLAYYLFMRFFPEGSFPLPSETKDNMQLNWDTLITHCLKPFPTKRPFSLSEVMDELIRPKLQQELPFTDPHGVKSASAPTQAEPSMQQQDFTSRAAATSPSSYGENKQPLPPIDSTPLVAGNDTQQDQKQYVEQTPQLAPAPVLAPAAANAEGQTENLSKGQRFANTQEGISSASTMETASEAMIKANEPSRGTISDMQHAQAHSPQVPVSEISPNSSASSTSSVASSTTTSAPSATTVVPKESVSSESMQKMELSSVSVLEEEPLKEGESLEQQACEEMQDTSSLPDASLEKEESPTPPKAQPPISTTGSSGSNSLNNSLLQRMSGQAPKKMVNSPSMKRSFASLQDKEDLSEQQEKAENLQETQETNVHANAANTAPVNSAPTSASFAPQHTHQLPQESNFSGPSAPIAKEQTSYQKPYPPTNVAMNTPQGNGPYVQQGQMTPPVAQNSAMNAPSHAEQARHYSGQYDSQPPVQPPLEAAARMQNLTQAPYPPSSGPGSNAQQRQNPANPAYQNTQPPYQNQRPPATPSVATPETTRNDALQATLTNTSSSATPYMSGNATSQDMINRVSKMVPPAHPKPILNPQEINRPVYDPDPGKVFQVESAVAPYKPEQQEIHDVEPILSEMVVISGGEYFRGTDLGQRDERPKHLVRVSDYAIDIHPTTNEQFALFLEAMGGEKESNNQDIIRLRESRIKRFNGKYVIESGYSKHPVIGVTWYGATAYAKWIGKRLPTEAEFEIACKGGDPEAMYPTGSDIDRSQANYFSSDTSPVMSYPSNGYGLYDMVGNVYEWCQDWYDYSFYETSTQEPDNPQGPMQGVYRVLRGGCWKSLKEDLRCTHRHRNNPATVNRTYGFRCAADTTR